MQVENTQTDRQTDNRQITDEEVRVTLDHIHICLQSVLSRVDKSSYLLLVLCTSQLRVVTTT